MISSLKLSDIEMLKYKPKDNNKCIIGVITHDTYNKITKMYGVEPSNINWKYKIVMLELNLFLKQIISMKILTTYINYSIPNICNNKLIVKIILNKNNRVEFISQYYISKFIKKSLLYAFFKSLIQY
jgi:hypothetical protein